MSSQGVLLQRLRDATRDAHQALHVHPFMLERFERHLTPRAYLGFLSLFRALWAELEEALSSHREEGILEPVQGVPTSKTRLLDLDLDGRARDLALTSSPDPLLAQSPLHALGYAYTLIGSSMGATQLVRRVQEQLPLLSTHYLSSPVGREEWRVLHRHLSSLSIDCDKQHCVARGALLCFTRVHEGFDELLTTPS